MQEGWSRKKTLGEGFGPKFWIYGWLPLERILRWAMLAQVLVDSSSGAGEVEEVVGEGRESQRVSKLIAEAKGEMIKGVPDWEQERGDGDVDETQDMERDREEG